jgi:hypothetical protein
MIRVLGPTFRPVLLALVLMQAAAARPAVAQAQDLPPAYPRPGATSLLENADVIVWDIAWLKQAYPFHRHRYDHVGVYYTSGDRIIVSTEGERRPVSTQAWNISFQLAGVTHSEEGASDEPLRAVFVQIKRAPRAPGEPDVSQRVFPVDAPTQRLENERVTVWEYGAGAGEELSHRHAADAVVVSFGADGRPSVRWVDRGTTHERDVTGEAERTFVFEIK